MTENYVSLASFADLSKQQVRDLAANAFSIAWVSPSRRDAFLRELDDYCAAFLSLLRSSPRRPGQ